MTSEYLELKVGLTTLLAILLLAGMLILVDDTSPFDDSYQIRVGFSDVQNLIVGGDVAWAGVKVGRVDALELADGKNPSQQVIAVLSIRSEVNIPSSAEFHVIQSGLFGTFQIRIRIPKSSVASSDIQYIARDSTTLLQGNQPVAFDQLLSEGQDTMRELRNTITHIREMLTDPQIKDDLKNTVVNVRAFSNDLKELLSDIRKDYQTVSGSLQDLLDELQAILKENRPHVLTTSTNLARILDNSSERIEGILKKTQTILDNVEGDGELARTMHDLRTNLSVASADFSRITSKVRTLVENPKVEKNLIDTLDSASDAAKSLRKVKDTIDSIRIEGVTDLLFNQGSRKVEGNFLLQADSRDGWVISLGAEDPGSNSGLNTFMGGLRRSGLTLKAGLLRDKFGIGLEKTLNPRLKLGLDAWDSSQTVGRLYTRYTLGKSYDLLLQWRDFSRSSDEFLMGVSQRF